MPANRRRLATGIYADRYGIAVRFTVHGTSKEYRFPADTPTDQLVEWRKKTLDEHVQESGPSPSALARRHQADLRLADIRSALHRIESLEREVKSLRQDVRRILRRRLDTVTVATTQ